MLGSVMQGLRERTSSPWKYQKTASSDEGNKASRRPMQVLPDTLRRIRQQARLRWSLFSPLTRSFVSLLLLWVSMAVLLRLWDASRYEYGRHPRGTAPQFAVVINTYKRPQQLKDAVKHYAGACGKKAGVQQVFVVWAELDKKPPPSFFDKPRLGVHTHNRAQVKVIEAKKNSLNSRFSPIDGLKLDSIFMVDDDIRVDCTSLTEGFYAWNTRQDTMVGYYPRLALPPRNQPKSTEYVYHSWPIVYWKQKMNFILTKASFLHKRYLDLYTNSPPEILAYVDKYFNCEDVAMSMLVANVTRSEKGSPAMPLYVEASISDKGLFNGISTGTGHMHRRSQCLTDLTQIYRQHGWEPPLAHVFDLPETTWMLHAPGFWWQRRPSNFFEWFAVENIFQ